MSRKLLGTCSRSQVIGTCNYAMLIYAGCPAFQGCLLLGDSDVPTFWQLLWNWSSALLVSHRPLLLAAALFQSSSCQPWAHHEQLHSNEIPAECRMYCLRPHEKLLLKVEARGQPGDRYPATLFWLGGLSLLSPGLKGMQIRTEFSSWQRRNARTRTYEGPKMP